MNPANLYIDKFAIPTIGGKSIFSFPTRTVTSHIGEIRGIDTSVDFLSKINCAFFYGKVVVLDEPNILTNIKWDNTIAGGVEQLGKASEAYIAQLIYMVRNHILCEGGNPQSATILYFLPESMSDDLKNSYKRLWRRLYCKLFSIDPETAAPNLKYLSESIAPYYFYKNNEVRENCVMTIDIGGGTTDIVMFNRDPQQLLFQASYGFGANKMYEVGYNAPQVLLNGLNLFFEGRGHNALYKKFGQDILTNEINPRDPRFETFLRASFRKSVEAINFWLTNDEAINFSGKLIQEGNQHYKLVFLFHYAATMYHIAQTIKYNDLAIPGAFCFSGNGSRYLKLINDEGLIRLRHLTRKIFAAVWEIEILEVGAFNIYLSPNPKEATAKGGIMYINRQVNNEFVPPPIGTLLGKDDGTTIQRNVVGTYNDFINDQTHLNGVKANVTKFVDLFVSIGLENFTEQFGEDITPEILNNFSTVMNEQIDHYFRSALATYNGRGHIAIKETMFFYPIIGLLGDMDEVLNPRPQN